MLKIYGSMNLAAFAITEQQIQDLKATARVAGAGEVSLEDTGRYLYARAIFLGYDLPNGNGDAIPSFYAAPFSASFIGKHVDDNHKLDPDSMVGEIMATWHVKNDLPVLGNPGSRIIGRNAFGWDMDNRPPVFRLVAEAAREGKELQMEGIFRVDRQKRAGTLMAEKLLAGKIKAVSQEASTGYCVCPVCTHKITGMRDLPCDHLSPGNLMMRAYLVPGYDHQVLAYKIHHDPTGDGLGCVYVPAYERADVNEIMAKLKQGTMNVQAAMQKMREQEIVWGSRPLILQASREIELIAGDIKKASNAGSKTVIEVQAAFPNYSLEILVKEPTKAEDVQAKVVEGLKSAKDEQQVLDACGKVAEELGLEFRKEDYKLVFTSKNPKAGSELEKHRTSSGGERMPYLSIESSLTITVKDGVIFTEAGKMVEAYDADRVAVANGFHYAEHFVKAHEGETLVLDEKTLKVVDDSKPGTVEAVKTLAAVENDSPVTLKSKLASLAHAQAGLNAEASFLARQSAVAATLTYLVPTSDLTTLASRIAVLAETQTAADTVRRGLLAALKVDHASLKGLPEGQLLLSNCLAPVKAIQAGLESEFIDPTTRRNHLDSYFKACMGLLAACGESRVALEAAYAEFSRGFDAWKDAKAEKRAELTAQVKASLAVFAKTLDEGIKTQVEGKVFSAGPVQKIYAAFGLPEKTNSTRRLRMRAGTMDVVAAFKTKASPERSQAIVEAMVASTAEWLSQGEAEGLQWAAGQGIEPKTSGEATSTVNGLASIAAGMGSKASDALIKAVRSKVVEAGKAMVTLTAAEKVAAKKKIWSAKWMEILASNPTPDLSVPKSDIQIKAEDLKIIQDACTELQAIGGPWPWKNEVGGWHRFLASSSDEVLAKALVEFGTKSYGMQAGLELNRIVANISLVNNVIQDRKLAAGLTAKFFRAPKFEDSHWTLVASNGTVAGRAPIKVAIGHASLDQNVILEGGKVVNLKAHLQSADYGSDLVAQAKAFGLTAMLGQFKVNGAKTAKNGLPYENNQLAGRRPYGPNEHDHGTGSDSIRHEHGPYEKGHVHENTTGEKGVGSPEIQMEKKAFRPGEGVQEQGHIGEAKGRRWQAGSKVKGGGGAGIVFENLVIDDGGEGMLDLTTGKITWKRLPTLERFDAMGYMDGMSGVRGSILKITGFDLDEKSVKEIAIAEEPEAEPVVNRSVTVSVEPKCDGSFVWQGGWVRHEPKAGDVIDSGESQGYKALQFDLLVNGAAENGVGADVRFEVTQEFVEFYQDVLDNPSEEDLDDAKMNWKASASSAGVEDNKRLEEANRRNGIVDEPQTAVPGLSKADAEALKNKKAGLEAQLRQCEAASDFQTYLEVAAELDALHASFVAMQVIQPKQADLAEVLAGLSDDKIAWLAGMKSKSPARHDRIVANLENLNDKAVVEVYLRGEMEGAPQALQAAKDAAAGKAQIKAMLAGQALGTAAKAKLDVIAKMIGGHEAHITMTSPEMASAFTTFVGGRDMMGLSLTAFPDGSTGYCRLSLAGFKSAGAAARAMAGSVGLSAAKNVTPEAIVAQLQKRVSPRLGEGLSLAESRRLHLAASTPEGFEHVVKELTKEKSVIRPWAAAWSLKTKGSMPAGGSQKKGSGPAGIAAGWLSPEPPPQGAAYSQETLKGWEKGGDLAKACGATGHSGSYTPEEFMQHFNGVDPRKWPEHFQVNKNNLVVLKPRFYTEDKIHSNNIKKNWSALGITSSADWNMHVWKTDDRPQHVDHNIEPKDVAKMIEGLGGDPNDRRDNGDGTVSYMHGADELASYNEAKRDLTRRVPEKGRGIKSALALRAGFVKPGYATVEYHVSLSAQMYDKPQLGSELAAAIRKVQGVVSVSESNPRMLTIKVGIKVGDAGDLSELEIIQNQIEKAAEAVFQKNGIQATAKADVKPTRPDSNDNRQPDATRRLDETGVGTITKDTTKGGTQVGSA